MSTTLFLPDFLTPTLNEYLNWHFHKRAKFARRCVEHIIAACAETGLPVFTEKVRITIQRNRRSGSREADSDNCTGGAKPLIDALTKCGIIADDSPQHIELMPVKNELVGMKGEYGTWIHIESIGAPA